MEILIYILKSSAILGLFFLIYEFLLKRDTFFVLNRIFLLTGILASVFLPFLNLTKTIVVEESLASAQNFNSEVLESSAFIKTISPAENTSFLASMEWFHILLIIYAIGVTVFLIKFLKSLMTLQKTLNYRPKSYVEKGIRFIETDKETNPFTFFNTVVYNPTGYSNSELKMILHHEKTHARQFHSLDMLIGQLILAFQWINPFAWFYAKRIDQNLEFIADRKTTLQKFPKKKYQISLLRAAYPGEIALPVNNFHSFTKIRILMLNKNKSHAINRLKTLMVLPFLVFFMMSFQMETVREIKTIPSFNVENDSISNLEVDKLNAIFKKQKKEAIVRFNGKQQRIKEIVPALYRIEALHFDPEGLPVITAEKKGDANLEASLEDFQQGLYLLILENSDIVLTREVDNSNDSIYVFPSAKKTSEKAINSEKDNAVQNTLEEEKTVTASEADKIKAREVLEMERRKLRDSLKNKNRQVSVEVRYEVNEERQKQREKLEKDRINARDSLREPRSKETSTMRSELQQERKIEKEKRSNFQEIRNVYVTKEGESKYIVAADKNNKTIVLRFEMDENTSDAALDNMVSKFAEAGVDFNYKNIKRNRDGKITRIKMTLNNRKGSQAKVSNQSSNGIGAYVLGLNEDGDIYVRNKN